MFKVIKIVKNFNRQTYFKIEIDASSQLHWGGEIMN